MEMDPKLVEWYGEAFDPAAMTLRVKAGATIKVGGEDSEEITLSEPVLGHVEEAYRKQGIERDRTLIALTGKTTPGQLIRMPVGEYNKAMTFLNFFTSAGPKAGDAASSS